MVVYFLHLVFNFIFYMQNTFELSHRNTFSSLSDSERNPWYSIGHVLFIPEASISCMGQTQNSPEEVNDFFCRMSRYFNAVLSSFITDQQISNKSNTADATVEKGILLTLLEHIISPSLLVGSCCSVFCVVFGRPLCDLLSFFA